MGISEKTCPRPLEGHGARLWARKGPTGPCPVVPQQAASYPGASCRFQLALWLAVCMSVPISPRCCRLPTDKARGLFILWSLSGSSIFLPREAAQEMFVERTSRSDVDTVDTIGAETVQRPVGRVSLSGHWVTVYPQHKHVQAVPFWGSL